MKRIFAFNIGILFFILCSTSVWSATTFGDKEQIDLSGKLQTRFTFSTTDREGFTDPQVDSGSMIQHRNLAYLELNHKLNDTLSYHLLGRGLYEGIYDYGPSEYKDVRENNKDEIDDFSRDLNLWKGFVDIATEKLFFRIGKQIISWGETDIIPMLDRINPLDNTYGGPLEALDDRRIPLWMAKGVWNIGDLGFCQSSALEGFINPGFADQEVAPLSPYGTPYAFAAPAASIPTIVKEPEDSLDGSRWGFRYQGVIDNNYNFSIAHYQTFNDSPVVRLIDDPAIGLAQELSYPKQSITGGSLSFYNDLTKAIYRFEAAYHWDEPVFIPGSNLAVPGVIEEKDVFRFSGAIDKNIWIRALNKRAMFNFTLSYFGAYTTDWDDDIRVAASIYPSGEFAKTKEFEQTFLFSANTNYHNGTITPIVAFIYDPRGAYLFAPQVDFIIDPFRLSIQYGMFGGNKDVSYGFYDDRDQISCTLSWLF